MVTNVPNQIQGVMNTTWKLSSVDKWLLAEITTELQKRFGVSNLRAEKLIRESNVLSMLM